jgi:hypothetical protein
MTMKFGHRWLPTYVTFTLANDASARLLSQATCQTEASWPEFYTKHIAEIDQKIAQLYQQQHPAIAELEDISAGPSTDFFHPEFESGPDQDPVMAFEAIR